MSQTDAQAACVAAGGNLASIHSDDDQAAARMACQIANAQTDDGDCWIGLNDAEAEGTFVWMDGTPKDYEHWNAGEPNAWGPAADGDPECVTNDCSDANCASRCNQPDSAEDGVNLRHVDDNSLAGSWNDQDPADIKPFVCSQPAGSCDYSAAEDSSCYTVPQDTYYGVANQIGMPDARASRNGLHPDHL